MLGGQLVPLTPDSCPVEVPVEWVDSRGSGLIKNNVAGCWTNERIEFF